MSPLQIVCLSTTILELSTLFFNTYFLFIPHKSVMRLKMFYYRGLQEWDPEKGYLSDTCLSAQDTFKKYLDYFRIPYEN